MASRVAFVPRTSYRAHQKGVALVTALLVVALAATAAVAMAVRQQLDIRRSANVLEHDQAQLYVVGVEQWAGQVLRRDKAAGETDHLGEDWAIDLPAIPVDGGQLAGNLEDMQGRFNVNSLLNDNGGIDELALKRFGLLLSYLALDPELADRLADWIDADEDARLGGAEDGEYLGLELPYRAANRPLSSISELRLVYGMDAPTYAKLAPYVSALPRKAALNVNTVAADKPELIMALAENIDPASAQQVLDARTSFGSVAEFIASQPALAGIAAQGLDVKSSYFMLTSHVQIGRSTYTTYSLLKRDPSSGAVGTVMRSQGTL